MALIETTAPAVEPVTLEEFKAYRRIDSPHEDTVLAALIVRARRHVEKVAGRALITQTLTEYFDGWPAAGVIRLQRPPLQSVSSLKYYDTDGTQQTWGSSNYVVDTASRPGRIKTAYGVSWPDIRTEGVANPISIEFIAGQGSTAASIAEEDKQAILWLASHMFANREPEITGGTASRFAFAWRDLLKPDRVVRLR